MEMQFNAEKGPSAISLPNVKVGSRRGHLTNKRKSLRRVVSKVLSAKAEGVAQDSIASRCKRQNHYAAKDSRPRPQRVQYDQEDIVFILTQMIKLADQQVDKHDGTRGINLLELCKLVSKRLGRNVTRRQISEKVRNLRILYMRKLLKTGTNHNVVNGDTKQEQIHKLGHQLWGGNCGLLKLHLEDDDGPVQLNPERVGLCSRDVGDPQDDSHGVKNNLPVNNMAINRGMHAGICNIAVKDGKKTIKPGGSSIEWDGQSVLKDKHQELLQALGMLEEMQTKFMTMSRNALETRNGSATMTGLFNDGSCVEKMLASSMLECGKSIPKHFQDRWCRIRIEELKLLSERLNLMLETCQLERENMERLIRQS